MKVAEALGRALVAEGAGQVFGVVGSGNFHITNALVAAGARFVAARHEGGAATMADAYSRMGGGVGLLSVHQGCGLTNAMTGIAEAAKSRTPLLVLAAEVTNRQSNFWVDQTALAESVGAVSARITSADTAVEQGVAAFRRARDERRTVILNLPLPVQDMEAGHGATSRNPDTHPEASSVIPSDEDVALLVAALRDAERPVFVAGRGSRGPGCREALEALADRTGALVATSAVAKGLFNGNPWSLDVSGGFSSPLAAELIRDADLIVGWGCALNMWTTRHGHLIGEDTRVIQVDLERSAIGAWQDRAEGVIGDVRATATAALEEVTAADGYRRETIRDRIAAEVRWRDVPYDDEGTEDRIDPRTLTIALDDLLPAERIVGVDSGNFMGHPSMFLSVPDEQGFCFTQAFQSIGLGLATTIGAALAQPDRLPVAAVGDGGLLMGVSELETVARLGLPMVVVVYNDEAYGAEVHHFGPHGHELGTVEFPPTDIAAVARGFGFEATTVRVPSDLAPVRAWLDGPRDRPLLIDAKVISQASWWLEEAFAGH
ncbi:TPP-requiring enzyme [Euzebya pacifica]|uniref:TPP-requiring enzyme n=1 Tax=Euzebya pacifica TaxID=1608957 RepID=A0A346XRE7_9ACTN|nr:thiamine pyrophosphate-binding protein [Euzebya pacifica]AXV04794.1 TPP-requiring enzyme [Euzebya pacifica]